MGGLPALKLEDMKTLFDYQNYTFGLKPEFIFDNGAIFNEDCIDFLKKIKTNSINTVFADPPYNIKKASWDNLGTIDEYVAWSISWIREASRVLKENGTLYICGFTEILADLKRPALEYFYKCKWLIWCYDNKANLSNDWGHNHESILSH